MAKNTPTRRKILSAAAKTIAAGAAGATSAVHMAHAQQRTITINPNARAVMPNGEKLDRKQILEKLGLDPNTPVDGWLVAIMCGNNAVGLDRAARERLLQQGIITQDDLK